MYILAEDMFCTYAPLPLVGMCGGGTWGSWGAAAALLSGFCLGSFLWARGEELEELLELVTVSPELHGADEFLKF